MTRQTQVAAWAWAACMALVLLLAGHGAESANEAGRGEPGTAYAQDSGGDEKGKKKDKDADEDDEDDDEEEESGDTESGASKSGFTPGQEQAILHFFTTTSASFTDDGRLHLEYDFETEKEELLVDWRPELDQFKNRLRWLRGIEGTFTTVEHGLVLADHGMWFHKAKWKNVRMRVYYLSMAGSRKGDLLATVFAYAKGKRIVGSNMGKQCVRLSGLKLAGKPIPTTWPILTAERRFDFGFELEDGVLSALQRGHVTATTEGNPKFLKKLGPGQAGMVWKGTINGFLFKVVLDGVLDPEWVKKQ